VIAIRCTAKLLSRLRTKPIDVPATSTSLLGDWYATLVRSGPVQTILVMASRTLLPIVMSARDAPSFPTRLASELEHVLSTYAVPHAAISFEVAAMTPASLARTNDRSLVGVLVEFQRQLEYHLEDAPAQSLRELSLCLAGTPIVARDTIPEVATCDLFGVPRYRWRP